MQKYEVLDSIPECYKKEYIGAGTNGVCYKTSQGEVFKEFKGTFTFGRDIEELVKIQSPFFAFPKKLVYVGQKEDNNLKGYLMDFVDGVTLPSLDRKTKIDTLIQASISMEKEIINLARYRGIILYYLNDVDVFILYDNSFKAVDTECFEYAPSNEAQDNIKLSMCYWSDYLLYNLALYYGAFKSDKLNLYFDIATTNGKFKASNMIEMIVDEIRKNTSNSIETLDDYYEGVKLIKRRNDI